MQQIRRFGCDTTDASSVPSPSTAFGPSGLPASFPINQKRFFALQESSRQIEHVRKASNTDRQMGQMPPGGSPAAFSLVLTVHTAVDLLHDVN